MGRSVLLRWRTDGLWGVSVLALTLASLCLFLGKEKCSGHPPLLLPFPQVSWHMSRVFSPTLQSHDSISRNPVHAGLTATHIQVQPGSRVFSPQVPRSHDSISRSHRLLNSQYRQSPNLQQLQPRHVPQKVRSFLISSPLDSSSLKRASPPPLLLPFMKANSLAEH